MCIISSQWKSLLTRPGSPNDHYLGHTNRTCNACRNYLHLLVQFGRRTAGRRQQEYKEIGYWSKCLVAIATWLKLRRQIAGRQAGRRKRRRQVLYRFLKSNFPGVGARGTFCVTDFEPWIRFRIQRSKIRVRLYVQWGPRSQVVSGANPWAGSYSQNVPSKGIFRAALIYT